MTSLVLGAGTMGCGIAQVLAQAGRRVTLVDVDPGALEAAPLTLRASLERLAPLGRLTEPAAAILERLDTVTDAGEALTVAASPTLVIESVPEDPDLKRRALARVEAICSDGTLIASNTSSIPIRELARALRHPERLVGLHFFNPVPRMPVVEVVAGERTAEDVVGRALALAGELGKDPVLVRRDVPGFVLNRIAIAASNEAIRLVADGVVSAEDVDRGVRGAFGWKMGPLETADLVGLDVVLDARSLIYQRTGDPRFEPPTLLRQLVDAGHLGRKTGRGFHEYGED